MDSSLWEQLSCLSKEKGRVRSRKKKKRKFLTGLQREMPNFREEPKSVSRARLPSLPELRGRMNGNFHQEAMGVLEWEQSILRFGECVSSQINAGRCCLIPNSLKKHFYFLMVWGHLSFFGEFHLALLKALRVWGWEGS